MRSSSQYILQLQIKADRQLPADFASRVVREAQRQKRQTGMYRAALLTGAACLAVTLFANWLTTATTRAENLKLWRQAVSQTATVQEWI